MQNSYSITKMDGTSVDSKDVISKDLTTSQTSLRSSKSLEKSSTSGSFKNEKGFIQFKEEIHDGDNQKHHHTDASLKVPHKIIANWRQACDRTKHKTQDLLKRWRTLPEMEAETVQKINNNSNSIDKENISDSCGWSVHVWRFTLNGETYLTKEGWLTKWSQIVHGAKNLCDFSVWLQFFVKVLFQVINRSGTGIITRDELSSFYSSVLGLDAVKVGEILDIAYQAMTSNGDHPLMFKAYRLCFANYLLGRYPNGPGQYILGAPPNISQSAMFPVDYSALNAQPEDLEQYAPDQKSNRRSVVV